jgi:putative ABC transport system permease protein
VASLSMILRLALVTLWENRLRSILTLVGMVFGNAAVIATLSSNEGAKVFIAKQLASLGNKLMTVELQGASVSTPDIEAVYRYVDNIDYAARERVAGDGQMIYRRNVTRVRIMGVENDYFPVTNLTLDAGRMFLPEELRMGEPVAIIGANVRRALFKDNPFMNEYVTMMVGTTPVMLRVIGVTREKGGAAANLDSSIFISPSLAVKITGGSSDRIMVLLRDDNQSIGVKNQITALLGPKYGSAMRVADAREAIERTKAIWGKQNLVGICLAAISLLTGGVGIMNIMLLSIHQRQKEIGLRKAVGARNSEIATQFLLETVIICVLGGLVGILVGWGFGQQVAKMLGDWEASMSLVSVLVALSFSVMTGVLFGATPAMRAARIDPYDALRTG